MIKKNENIVGHNLGAKKGRGAFKHEQIAGRSLKRKLGRFEYLRFKTSMWQNKAGGDF